MSNPLAQITQAARGVAWNILALAAVLPILFMLLVWQLATISPTNLCRLVQNAPGVPPGDSCFKIIDHVLTIRGWTIYGLLGVVGLFVLICIVAAVKAVVSLVGPGNLSLNLKTQENNEPPQTASINKAAPVPAPTPEAPHV